MNRPAENKNLERFSNREGAAGKFLNAKTLIHSASHMIGACKFEKRFQWTKIAPTSIVNGQGLASVWGELARQSTGAYAFRLFRRHHSFLSPPSELSLDFDMIDGMFAVSTSPAPSTHMDSSPAQVASERIASLINKQRFVNCIIHTYIGLNEKGHEYTYNLPSARALTSASVGTKSMSTVSVQ